jgi:hypothetical protein
MFARVRDVTDERAIMENLRSAKKAAEQASAAKMIFLVGPYAYCSPRHSTHCEPPSLEVVGIIRRGLAESARHVIQRTKGLGFRL